MRFSLLLILFWVSTVSASTLSIPINDEGKLIAASDLEFNGVRLDEVEAQELKLSGIDLSELDPFENLVWKKDELNLELTAPVGKLKFLNTIASPTELFRMQVIDEAGKTFVVSASIHNHATMLRAQILRKSGYQIDLPLFQKTLNIEFEDKTEKDSILEKMGEATLLKKEKWVKRSTETSLTLKAVLLEPSEAHTYNIYWPFIDRSWQKNFRTFRALIYYYSLTNFPQDINEVSWSDGRIFNEKLVLNHPMSAEFLETTIDDFKWAHKKMLTIDADEYLSMAITAGYPQDIALLIAEKLKARVNHYSNLMELESIYTRYHVNFGLTQGLVIGGKLTGGNYEADWVNDFFHEDEDSPYRFSELFKLFRTQLLYSSVSSLMNYAVESFLPGAYLSDARDDINAQMTAYRQNNHVSVLPIKTWSAPFYNGKVFASRNIVFGQFLGSTAPIQVADSLGAEANLGVFTNISGLSETILPTVSAGVALSRNYVHVRPVEDLSAATSRPIKDVAIPLLMKRLAKILRSDIECSISGVAFTEEVDLNGEKIINIKYDKNKIGGKDEAIKLREKLINGGVPASKILLVPIDRDALCATEVEEARKQDMEDFLKTFSLNETFIITDQIRMNAGVNVTIPIPQVPRLNANVGEDNSYTILKSFVLRKTKEGLSVAVQVQKNGKLRLEAGLSYFVDIIKNTTQWTKGKMNADFYNLKLEKITNSERVLAVKILREIFLYGTYHQLKEEKTPLEMDHDIFNRLNTFRLLFFKQDKLKMKHHLAIRVTDEEDETKTDTREFYSVMDNRRQGADYHAFLDRLVSSFSQNLVSLGANDGDPGQSLGGTSYKEYFRTEGELTTKHPLNPVTKIEYIRSGWKVKKKKLLRWISDIEEHFTGIINRPLVDVTPFNHTTHMHSYDISTTIILYPGAMEKIKDRILKSSEAVAINILKFIYTDEEWNDFCERAEDFFGSGGPQVYYGEKTYSCVPSPVQEMMRYRTHMPSESNRVEFLNYQNEFWKLMFKNFYHPRLLEFIGVDNYFANARIRGYRNNTHEGSIDLITDSVGKFSDEFGTGLYDEMSARFGVSGFEIKAMSYTPGM
jgi:hypothetical protein